MRLLLACPPPQWSVGHGGMLTVLKSFHVGEISSLHSIFLVKIYTIFWKRTYIQNDVLKQILLYLTLVRTNTHLQDMVNTGL